VSVDVASQRGEFVCIAQQVGDQGHGAFRYRVCAMLALRRKPDSPCRLPFGLPSGAGAGLPQAVPPTLS
jgi:hypothetical protein